MRNLVIISALMGAAPSTAFAQQYGTGTGFPIGEKSRIHTGLDLTMVYDSNSLRAAPGDSTRADWKGIIRPSVGVVVPGSSVRLNLQGRLSIMQYLGRGTLGTDQFADTLFGGDVTTDLTLGSQDSIISFTLKNQLVRTPAFIDDPGTVTSDERRFPLWHNRGQAYFTIRPGGRALEFDVGYSLTIDAYDSLDRTPDGGTTTALPTGFTHRGVFEARWKFFPKTAFIFHGDAGYFTASNTNPVVRATFDGIPIRIWLGAIGQVTTKLNAEITAGYADTLSDGGGNFTTRGPIGSLIFSYAFTEQTQLSLGYRRRISPVVILNSFSSDAPFARFTLGLGGRLSFSLFGEYQFRKYARAGNRETGDRANVQVVTGDARVDFWFFSWLSAGLGYRLQIQSPEDGLVLPNNVFFLDFTRHQIFANVGVRY